MKQKVVKLSLFENNLVNRLELKIPLIMFNKVLNYSPDDMILYVEPHKWQIYFLMILEKLLLYDMINQSSLPFFNSDTFKYIYNNTFNETFKFYLLDTMNFDKMPTSNLDSYDMKLHDECLNNVINCNKYDYDDMDEFNLDYHRIPKDELKRIVDNYFHQIAESCDCNHNCNNCSCNDSIEMYS